MDSKVRNYLIYGGGSKVDFRRVYPRLQYENHKVWKLISVLLLLMCVVGVLFNVPRLFEDSNGRYIFSVITFTALAFVYLVAIIFLYAVVTPAKPKLLSWVIYSVGTISVVAAYVFACLDTNTFSIALAFTLVFGGFIYIDRPIKNYLLFSSGLPFYLVFSIINKSYTNLATTIIIWFLGITISSYINYRRIFNHMAMINIERLGNTDSLTGVFNKNKYDDTVSKLQKELTIRDVEFAVVVFDVNRLKETNDTYGHNHGDELLIRSVELIKEVFKKSEIYRIGGDEFCCILFGEDYEHRSALITNFHNKVENIHLLATSLQRDTSVAAGLATFDPGADSDYTMVFSRADMNMYRNKIKLKSDNKFPKQVKNPEEEVQ